MNAKVRGTPFVRFRLLLLIFLRFFQPKPLTAFVSC